jgi:hypothetical protein
MKFIRGLLLATLVVGLLSGCTSASLPPTTVQATKAAPTPNSTPTVLAATSTLAPGCTVRTSQSRPDPTVESLLSPIGEKDWTQGPQDASVTILEYSDFQ